MGDGVGDMTSRRGDAVLMRPRSVVRPVFADDVLAGHSSINVVTAAASTPEC